ncbi:hypothetical protein HU742_017705 [Pseudomonas sp. SWRI102]|uniref:Phosphatidylinositol diacylglycerol-lyase n=1 Tax=Pseudomonas marvdashtae TaxID=2745500 RepID=A0A923FP89_9PSED|nr:hypothetical protein [Pseudomonas marvdashtae]MBV4552983.1 hypothetical protein [Pseudomonas marvdashtae]
MSTPDRWMGSTPGIYKLRIDELILPGTHDSGSDKEAPKFLLPNEITQDVPIRDQINRGFRVIDLRVELFPSQPVGHPRRFQLYHLTSSGRTIADDVLGVLNAFYAEPARRNEIIILNFHQFKNFTDSSHEELQQLINQMIGARLIPYAFRPMTLAELRQETPERTVVISYNSNRGDDDYWPGVEQQWIGKDYISTSTLKEFMDDVSAQPKRPYALRAIQCAKYTGLFVPDDFSDKVDAWFESKDINSYIQRFHIINTDWSTRSNIVINCAHANQFRAMAKD